MALVDDKDFKTVGMQWELLLEGEGVITNMGGPGENLDFRFDSNTPGVNDVSRSIYGRSAYDNKDSFVNQSSDSKIYGKGATGVVKVLVTRDIV